MNGKEFLCEISKDETKKYKLSFGCKVTKDEIINSISIIYHNSPKDSILHIFFILRTLITRGKRYVYTYTLVNSIIY
jgi:hypothetical protein